MKIEVIDKDELTREISIEVPAEKVNSKFEEKMNEKSKEAHIKGYRKGKAPRAMIESLYADEIKADLAEEVIKETYPEAIRTKELKVASYPMVTDFKFNDDGSINYTASVEVFPEIDKVDFKGLKLEVKDVEVTDENVDEVIESMQKNMADKRTVDRAVLENDLVVLDIEKLDDPTGAIPSDKFENQEVDLSNKMTIVEFKENLPGLKAGESKEVTVVYKDDYPDKTFAGHTIKYNCTIKEVKEIILDEINDGFAKKTQQAETLLELRLSVRERLQSQKEEENSRERKSVVIDHIVKKNDIPVPKALVEDYLKNVVENFKQQYKDQPVDEAEIKKNYEPIGINTIRWNMLMHKLSELEKISVEQTDIDNIISKFAENYKMSLDQAKQALAQSGNIADLKETILEDKVIDFIVTSNNG